VKINTDAVFYADSNQGALAYVIRDDRGVFGAARATWYVNGLDACSLEALACRDNLRLAVHLGLQRVALETDCLHLVQLWQKKESQRSAIHHILREIEELSLAFREFTFSFVSRTCNKVAHLLARLVSSSHRSETWHVTPTCVYDLIVSEASAG